MCVCCSTTTATLGDDFGWGSKDDKEISSTAISVRIVSQMLKWEVKVSERWTWVMGPDKVLGELLPDIPPYVWEDPPPSSLPSEG